MGSAAIRPTSSRASSPHAFGSSRSRIPDAALWLVLAACVARLWLVQLPSSFWVDETVTAFVVAHPGHRSFAVARQVPESIYYALPAAARALWGVSEVFYRIPSVLAMAIALFFIGRIAGRLIHPGARWFAVFACMGLRGINYHAADARPYALGICISAAALWFLIRWLEANRWFDAALFIAFAALLWRVHLIYWPFYLIFAIYAAVRISARETPVRRRGALAVGAILTAALLPVVITASVILRNAGAHVIANVPDIREFEHEVRWNLVVLCAGAVWLAGRVLKWPREENRIPRSSFVLIAAWWLCQPVVLFLYSHLTGNSVFVGRYLSICLPGIALAATAGASMWLPARHWRTAALVLGLGVLAVMGRWENRWPRHDNSDWRGAASEETRLADPSTPVLCISPFIEARTPAWTPDYPLPGFLYSHLEFYPVRGARYLLPFESQDGAAYAAALARGPLPGAGRFLIYGSDKKVDYWVDWFRRDHVIRDWRSRVETFGDISLAVFESR